MIYNEMCGKRRVAPRQNMYLCRVEDTAEVAVPEVQQSWVTPGLTSERFNLVNVSKLEHELRRCSVVIIDAVDVAIDRFKVSNS